MTQFDGTTILITGASRGIGEAAARYLAEAGANVVLSARSGAAVERIAAEIGPRALGRACDVANWEDVRATVAAAEAQFGGVDALVNNAGLIDPIARIEDSDPAAWARVVDVNLTGAYYMLRAVLPGMLARGSGTVINISSGAAVSALEGWSHYSATKAALLSLTRTAHKELADKGIRVVGLSPGTVATDMQRQIKASGVNPVSGLEWEAHIPPEWVARAIAWLMTEAGRAHDGGDFSLKTEEGRRAVGLPTP
ncbi:MAG: SDR family oxidoreductase [Paracoccaceae bacterium]